MAINNKGQLMLLGVMLFAMAFIAATMMIKPLMDVGSDARTSMSCELDNQTQGTYIACLAIDIFPAMFFAMLITAGASLVVLGKTGE